MIGSDMSLFPKSDLILVISFDVHYYWDFNSFAWINILLSFLITLEWEVLNGELIAPKLPNIKMKMSLVRQ